MPKKVDENAPKPEKLAPIGPASSPVFPAKPEPITEREKMELMNRILRAGSLIPITVTDRLQFMVKKYNLEEQDGVFMFPEGTLKMTFKGIFSAAK